MKSLPATPRPRTSHLLIAESVLVVQPTLAVVIGLNEAIFLQQVQYWCNKSQHHRDGRVWVYNSIPEWQEQLPFWGTATIFRIIKSLRDKGVLVTTGEYNENKHDRTLWYAIDHDALDSLIAETKDASYQSDEMGDSRAQDPSYQSDEMLIEQETTQEITQEIGVSPVILRIREHDARRMGKR